MPYSLAMNRVGPPSYLPYLRPHMGGIRCARQALAGLGDIGAQVLNGYDFGGTSARLAAGERRSCPYADMLPVALGAPIRH